MLNASDNALLTQTGAGTPMGKLFRAFWQPVLLSSELPKPDCSPVKVTIMGEELRAFRASDGTVGLVEPRCPHRGADLFYGRNEDGGLRCVYHGWKFAADGRCMELPIVEPGPERDRMMARIKLKAYPARDFGGFIWAYLGPKEQVPALPQLEFALLPPAHSYVTKKLQQCNWAHPLEGAIDTAHFSFLHMAVSDEDDTDRLRWIRNDPAPRYTVVAHPAGLVLGAARKADNGDLYWRVSQFLMPNHVLAPNAHRGEIHAGQCYVPIDDNHCWIFNYTWNPERPLTEAERETYRKGLGVHPELDEQWVPVRNRLNDYLLDRDKQRTINYTGVDGISEQDAYICDSQGYIADRTSEHLAPTDLGIVRFRRLMLDAARKLEQGTRPEALSHPDGYCARGGGTVAPGATPFADVMRERFGHELGRITRAAPAVA